MLLTGANTYTGLTIVGSDSIGGVLELGAAAQSRVLTAGGANIQAGKLVFDYPDQAATIGTRDRRQLQRRALGRRPVPLHDPDTPATAWAGPTTTSTTR